MLDNEQPILIMIGTQQFTVWRRLTNFSHETKSVSSASNYKNNKSMENDTNESIYDDLKIINNITVIFPNY